MDYNIIITKDAQDDLDLFIDYLVNEKKNSYAAKNVLNDFEETIEILKVVAGSLKLCDNPKLKKYNYHRINFIKHKYFMLYRIENNNVYVDRIFHELQDFVNKLS